jgi:hypothetical protein
VVRFPPPAPTAADASLSTGRRRPKKAGRRFPGIVERRVARSVVRPRGRGLLRAGRSALARPWASCVPSPPHKAGCRDPALCRLPGALCRACDDDFAGSYGPPRGRSATDTDADTAAHDLGG